MQENTTVDSTSVPKPQILKNTQPDPPSEQTAWVKDTSLADLTNIIAEQLQQDANNLKSSTYDSRPDNEMFPHQHIRFNLLRHRGIVSDIPTIQLFEEFAMALRTADPMLAFLPYESSKQHYSSINTQQQIQTINSQHLQTFFWSYYQKQLYYLSGYFHICSALTFDELISHASKSSGVARCLPILCEIMSQPTGRDDPYWCIML
jgi:hypothetical protein